MAHSSPSQARGAAGQDERATCGYTFEENVLPPYTFDPSLSTDDNYLVWSMTYIRCSTSRRGQMACLMVDPTTNKVLLHSNNTPLQTFLQPPAPGVTPTLSKKSPPELHAEARCIALSSARGISLAGATAYITFPPCDVCFHMLSACGVQRVVFRNALRSNETRVLALAKGVELVELGDNRTEAGRAWDENIRRRAGVEWDKLGETAELTKKRNAEAWARQAEESVELSRSVVEAGEGGPLAVQLDKKKPVKVKAAVVVDPGKKVVASAVVAVVPSEVPAKRAPKEMDAAVESGPAVKVPRMEPDANQ